MTVTPSAAAPESVTAPVMSQPSDANQVWYTGKPARRVNTKVSDWTSTVGSNQPLAPSVSAAAALPVSVRVAAFHVGWSVPSPEHAGPPAEAEPQ
ncbi:hypothetical protein GCM10010403_43350 [Glycomyces rutgersensis]|uniref:Uncharacterized protein n=1 Tax=Glycomyces rutgersensis TaxID=58115 RepID=A0ABN3G6F6_9ACTN